MKALWLLFVVAMNLASAVAGFYAGRGTQAPPPAPAPRPAPTAVTTHSGPTTERVMELSEWVTERVEVADVLETSVEGYTGGLKVAVVVRGDFLLGVDLSRARVKSVDAEAGAFVLTLPPPRASSPRLDHSRTHVFAVSDRGLWAVVPGDAGRSRVVERAFEEAQRALQSRVEAHILVAFLGYAMTALLRKKLSSHAPGLTPAAALEMMKGIRMVDVCIPTTDGRWLIMPRHTEPEPRHEMLLERLGLTLPPQPPRIRSGQLLGSGT